MLYDLPSGKTHCARAPSSLPYTKLRFSSVAPSPLRVPVMLDRVPSLSFPVVSHPPSHPVRLREDVVMVVTVMLCVGRCKLGAVERRSWLGLGGVGIVMAAGLAAYGVCSGFGETDRALIGGLALGVAPPQPCLICVEQSTRWAFAHRSQVCTDPPLYLLVPLFLRGKSTLVLPVPGCFSSENCVTLVGTSLFAD